MALKKRSDKGLIAEAIAYIQLDMKNTIKCLEKIKLIMLKGSDFTTLDIFTHNPICTGDCQDE